MNLEMQLAKCLRQKMTNKTDTRQKLFEEWLKDYTATDCSITNYSDVFGAGFDAGWNTRIAEQASDTSSNCEHEPTCDASGYTELRQQNELLRDALSDIKRWLGSLPPEMNDWRYIHQQRIKCCLIEAEQALEATSKEGE